MAPTSAPELPIEIILHEVLQRLPANSHAYTAKLVCKAAYLKFKQHTCISAHDPNVSLQVLQTTTISSSDVAKLQQARAKAGDLNSLIFLTTVVAPYSN